MINEKLEKLLIKIPNFTEQCKSFCSTSKNINSLRKLNTLTLSKTAELLEILELPQLMETCLRNNLYTEALELSQYARHLSTKHGSIPIIAVILFVNYSLFKFILKKFVWNCTTFLKKFMNY